MPEWARAVNYRTVELRLPCFQQGWQEGLRIGYATTCGIGPVRLEVAPVCFLPWGNLSGRSELLQGRAMGSLYSGPGADAVAKQTGWQRAVAAHFPATARRR